MHGVLSNVSSFTLAEFVCIFSTVSFQMYFQTVCTRGCMVTVAAFVWLFLHCVFSNASSICLHWQMYLTIAQLGVQYGHMGYYFMTVAFMLVIVMLLSCCVPYHVVLLLDVMFILLHLSCLVCMYPNCFVAFPLYILVHGCPCFFVFGF